MKIFKIICQSAFFYLIRNSCFFILVPLYRWLVIKERHPDGSESTVHFSQGRNHKLTILALHADGFRGDLEALAGTGAIRVLRINRNWQTRLITCFYSRELQGRPGVVVRHYNTSKKEDPELHEAKRLTQEFMKGFLSRLYQALSIKAVILYNTRYLPDRDWAEVSKRIGAAYIVIFREGSGQSPEDFELMSRRLRKFGRFKGDHITVVNSATKQCFVESGYANEDEVTVCGALRMDSFIRRINRRRTKSTQPLVTMFWWSIHQFETQEFSRLTIESLEGFAELAREMPGVRFVIKPKPTQVPPTEYILQQLRRYKGPTESLPKSGSNQLPIENEITRVYPEWLTVRNLTIEPWANVHDLILKSTVICAFDSTTLLESGLAGKPIVIPYFDKFRETKEGKLYKFREILDAFDVANNKAQFKERIESRLSDSSIESGVQDRRRVYFASYVSDLSGMSVEKTKKLILDLAVRGCN